MFNPVLLEEPVGLSFATIKEDLPRLFFCFLLSLPMVAAFGSIFQVDAPTGSTEYYQTIFLNVFESFVLLGLGLIFPLIARWQRNHENA